MQEVKGQHLVRVLGLTCSDRVTVGSCLLPVELAWPPAEKVHHGTRTKSRRLLWIGQPEVQQHPTAGQQELLPHADAETKARDRFCKLDFLGA